MKKRIIFFQNIARKIIVQCMNSKDAAVAQLVERVLGKDEVHGFDPRQQLEITIYFNYRG